MAIAAPAAEGGGVAMDGRRPTLGLRALGKPGTGDWCGMTVGDGGRKPEALETTDSLAEWFLMESAGDAEREDDLRM